MDSLLYQKELLDVQRTLQTQKRALVNSKNELATLMGLLPSEKFTLAENDTNLTNLNICLLNTSPSPRDKTVSRMPSSA